MCETIFFLKLIKGGFVVTLNNKFRLLDGRSNFRFSKIENAIKYRTESLKVYLIRDDKA